MCLFFLIYTGGCSGAILSNKLEGVTMPGSAQCMMSLRRLINFCLIKMRAPLQATAMYIVNMDGIRRALPGKMTHLPGVVPT